MPACDSNLVATYLAGELSREEGARVGEHIDTCEDCLRLYGTIGRTVIAPPSTSDIEELAPSVESGGRVGRYVVTGLLGEGGMGVVYAAHDPELDRPVALKVIRPDATDRWDQASRLLREARAMARVEHRNVVAVFDAGIHGPQVFVAMARVEGTTLRAWLAARPRSVREIVDVFVEAGRGLAAAHAAGVIHRDFKPENVLVGNDGRPRVADFGLARTPLAESGSIPPELESAATLLTTQTGTILGTPAYLPPERYRAQPLDARSDQFAFAVALYEALYGERPFPGENLVALRASVTSGKVRPAPRGSRVPRWLRRVVLRALAVEPDARFPSMDAMLAELGRDRRAGWRRAAAAAVLVTIAVGAAVAGWRAHRASPIRPVACGGAGQDLAGVWDGPRKKIVHDAFVATAAPYAGDAWRETERTLDAFARDWTAAHAAACAAVDVGRGADAEMVPARLTCLARRLDQVRELTDVFAHADPRAVENAAAAVHALPPLAACSEVGVLASRGLVPVEPSIRTRVDDLRGQLARAAALQDAGKYEPALALAARVANDARAVAYPPLLAEALFRRGVLEYESMKMAAAETTLLETVSVAESARHDALAAEAWTLLVPVTAWLSHFEKEAWSEERAEAALARIDDHGALRVGYLLHVSRVRLRQGKVPDASAKRREALALAEKALGPEHPQTAEAALMSGYTEAVVGDLDRGIAVLTRSVALFERLYGAEHPKTADALLRTGEVLLRAGRYEEGRKDLERALAINERTHGKDNLNVAEVLRFLGRAMVYLGRARDAVALAERSVAIQEAALGAENPNVAYYRYDLGLALEASGDLPRARQVLEQAQALVEAKLGKTNTLVGGTLDHLGRIALAERRLADALALEERALPIREASFGPESGDVAAVLTQIGRVHLATGKVAAAIPPLERAVAIHGTRPGRPAEAADARFALAQALWEASATGHANEQRPRAIGLARVARDGYAADGPGSSAARSGVEAWLARRAR
jgi:tetratricopeptide (TPR) repeat protein